MKTEKAVRQLYELEKLAPRDMRLAAEWSLKQKWKILIATILSAQTKDETTISVCNVLFKKFTSLKKLGNARLSSIEKIIRPINYYKTKARNIKKTARLLTGKKIPSKVDELLELPGVGRKVANVYLAVAENKNVIGVDTHVARLSQKLGWTKNTNPHKIEKDLEKLFPKRYYRDINYILVRFGRWFGRSRGGMK